MESLQFSKQVNPREVFKNLQTKYNGKTVSESYLRSEVQISNTGVLQFEISSDNVGTTTRNNTERRLNRNDLFVATQMGLFLKVVDTLVHGKSLLYTYPNAEAFVTDGTNFIREDLEALWNGYITVRNGAVTTIEALDARKFRKSPVLPFGTTNAAVISSADAITAYEIATDPQGPEDGFVDLPAYLVFSGAQQHEVSLNIPGGASLKIDNTNSNKENWAVLYMRGFLVKNANLAK